MKGKKRLHFGVIFSMVDNTCQYDVWTGISRFAHENDISVTAYIGQYQATDEDFASHFDTIFETIKSTKSLDGIIIFSGFIAQTIGNDEFEKFVERIPKHIPLVSISFIMPGVPSVLVDNMAGVYAAIEHLITVHGKKQIAFVKGPDGHPEAEARLLGYRNALKDYGIAYDERYVFPGHFIQSGGRDAVQKLQEMPELTPDAIAACDDETAIGVLLGLKSHAVMVPSEIAVVGFDDDRFSATFIPAISTARQDFHEIGLVSAKTLLRKIRGEEVLDITYVPPVFIARQSCGCSGKEFMNSKPIYQEGEVKDDSLDTLARNKLVPLFPPSISEPLIHEWIADLVNSLKRKPFSQEKFLAQFSDTLVSFHHHSSDFSIWNNVLNILTVGVELHHDEVDCPHTILSALILATTLIHDTRFKGEKIREFQLDDDRMMLRRIAGNLVLSFNIDSLARELHASLPELSIYTTLLGIYRKPIKSNNPYADRTIDTLIGVDNNKQINIKHNSKNPIYFSDYSSIKNFDFDSERRDLFFIPLFFKDEELGIMLIPFDPNIHVDVYETLRVNISTAIKGAELISQIQTLSITDELTGLLNRRGFFHYVYSRIPHLNRESELVPIVMFMDMDGLKAINDTYGHSEGDIAISAFANILKQILREEDIVGRIGGDEFVVFSSVKSKVNAEKVEQRIREKMDEYNREKNHPYDVMASIGSVVLEHSNVECFEAAMLSADNVLYEEKSTKKKQGLSRG